MAKILLVEDDRKLSSLIRTYLIENEYLVECLFRGDEVLSYFTRNTADLVVLDLMLPGCDGFEVCKQLRAVCDVPILMLTARGEDIDHVIGLELGADDFVVKPVQPRVLLARIKALFRRQQANLALQVQEPLRCGNLLLDRAARQIFLNGIEMELTSSEFELLNLLVERAGTVISRDEILQQLRGIDFDGYDRSADVIVSRLRRKLGTQSLNRIKTVWSRGYMLTQVQE